MKVTMYRLDDEVARKVGMPPGKIPVRSGSEAEVFGGDSVDLDVLVREVDATLGEDIEFDALYGAALARLADAAGQAHAERGNLVDACAMFRLGLKRRPWYPGLNTKMAFALQQQGRLNEASHHYDIALIRRDEPTNPIVLILAARNRADLHDIAGALALLDRCPGGFWEDDAFRDLYTGLCADLEHQAAEVVK